MGAPPHSPDADRRPGRPRDSRADEAIMDAAVSVLADRGPGGFTVDEVAARAGCGKATVYRRWPSRSALLLDTANRLGLEPPNVDTGSLRDDLIALATALGTKMRETPAGRMLPSITAEAAVNPEMREVLRAFVRDRRQRPRAVVQRAVARGELPPDTDVDLLVDLLGGTVIYRELFALVPTDEAMVNRLVDALLTGFGWTGVSRDAAGGPPPPLGRAGWD
jgi:AcrR family transcriptional regulator